ncbi:MAG: hypothetical protein HOL66_06265 [Rhodospirillaceae bacterium]|jgi:hypothetical protein|nr:hypothetical protein [Rhodospirillaceae bacterium]MBT5243828.1 hypothetical protein [Rhodospirillaceae bacterium]MBT5562877.1 hypothetical protein [Rhodospirillaceae bacterium]MBT6241276.1 hypothetical protein [Rhodospirillaceae bacterium]MBT7137130.1 hypothetical protein [Rhodospirillaceae bacterium]
MRFILIFSAFVFLSLPVAAEQKYSTWSNPDGGGGTTKELVDKLNALIDEAEKSRAADPVFLRDLRALTSGFAVPQNVAPQNVSVLSDDFSDGDFNSNPVWNVSEGRFWIEKDWGLRSAITPGATAAPEQEKKASSKDLAIAIFGAVLKQATKSKSEPTQSAAAKPQVATIHSIAAIANAFAIEFELSSWQPQGRFDIGPFQGTDTNSGYRLSYAPGGALALHRVSARGSSVVKQATSLVPLEDQKSHTILWSRDSSAMMSVSIDGKVVLTSTDRSFSDPFQGIAISNRGGDYIIKRIAVSSIN